MELVFIDTEVCLVILTERQSFYRPAAQLFSLADRKKIVAGVLALSFSNIHYILRQELPVTLKTINRQLFL